MHDETYNGQNMGRVASPKLGKASRYGAHMDLGVALSYMIATISGTQPLGDSSSEASANKPTRLVLMKECYNCMVPQELLFKNKYSQSLTCEPSWLL